MITVEKEYYHNILYIDNYNKKPYNDLSMRSNA